MKRIISALTKLTLCSYVSLVSAQTLKTDNAQLDSIVNELRELGAIQDSSEIDYIPNGFDIDSTSINPDWPIVYTNSLEEVGYGDYKKNEILGAIKFVEEFIDRICLGQVNFGMPSMVFPYIQIILNYDCSVFHDVTMAVIQKVHNLKCGFVCMPNENLLGFDRIEVSFYPYPFRSYQVPLSFTVLYEIATGEYYILNVGYDFNADDSKEETAELMPVEVICEEASPSEVEVKGLPIKQLSEVENHLTSKMDALGAIHFDAFPKTEAAEHVSLHVMVFQNIEDGSFSIFSIK